MSAKPLPDCLNFERAVPEALRAELAAALDLAMTSSSSFEIAPVISRVAFLAASEGVRPEEMVRCVKALWLLRQEAIPSVWLPADDRWLRVVRALLAAYYTRES